MGGRQAVRPRTLDPVSKVRILPAQPLYRSVGLTRHYLVSLKERRFAGNGAPVLPGYFVIGVRA
jgi:hypothetical protein